MRIPFFTRPNATPRSGWIQLADGVILRVIDNQARLFDLNREAFFGLDPIGTHMLQTVLEHGCPAAAARLATTYEGVTEQQLRADIDELINQMNRQRLVISGVAKSPGTPATSASGQTAKSRPIRSPARTEIEDVHSRHIGPSRTYTLILLALAWLVIRACGWLKAISLCRRIWPIRRGLPFSPQGRDHAIHEIDQVVRQAAASHWLPTQCKEKSLVAFALLRAARLNVDVQLVIGIAVQPFGGHAWVESRSESGRWIVADDAERVATFQPIAAWN